MNLKLGIFWDKDGENIIKKGIGFSYHCLWNNIDKKVVHRVLRIFLINRYVLLVLPPTHPSHYDDYAWKIFRLV